MGSVSCRTYIARYRTDLKVIAIHCAKQRYSMRKKSNNQISPGHYTALGDQVERHSFLFAPYFIVGSLFAKKFFFFFKLDSLNKKIRWGVCMP